MKHLTSIIQPCLFAAALWLMPSTLCAQQTEADLEKAIKQQKEQIDKLNHDLARLQKENERLGSQLSMLKRELDMAREREEQVGRIDNIIFQQCLLFTLERRYDAERIKTAQDCVNSLALWNNAKYKDACKDRMEMMDKYKAYNDELTNFLLQQKAMFESATTPWVNDALTESMFTTGLKELSYYNDCYLSRKAKPFRTIPYLNDVIDTLIEMISGKYAPISKNEYEAIIKKLQPKQP